MTPSPQSPARLAATVALAAVLMCACALNRERLPAAEEPARVRDIEEIRRRLQVADASLPNLLLGEIGSISSAGLDAPIWRMAYRSFEPDSKRILVAAGSRGSDAAGVRAALELVDRLAEGEARRWRCDLDIVPLVNPWGYVHGIDSGKDGTDIELDFVSFESSEARVIRRFLREKRYDLAVVLREAPAEGFTLVQYGLGDAAAARRIAEKLRTLGYAPSRQSRLAFQKPVDGVLLASPWGLAARRWSRTLSLAGYLRDNCSPVVFAVETPAWLPLADRLTIQRVALDMLIEEFGGGRGSR